MRIALVPGLRGKRFLASHGGRSLGCRVSISVSDRKFDECCDSLLFGGTESCIAAAIVVDLHLVFRSILLNQLVKRHPKCLCDFQRGNQEAVCFALQQSIYRTL